MSAAVSPWTRELPVLIRPGFSLTTTFKPLDLTPMADTTTSPELETAIRRAREILDDLNPTEADLKRYTPSNLLGLTLLDLRVLSKDTRGWMTLGFESQLTGGEERWGKLERLKAMPDFMITVHSRPPSQYTNNHNRNLPTFDKSNPSDSSNRGTYSIRYLSGTKTDPDAQGGYGDESSYMDSEDYEVSGDT